MRHHGLSFVLMLAAVVSTGRRGSADAPGAGADGARGKLVWADEFNIDGPPDPSKWRFEEGFVRNHELQWYQRENASCRDGLLVIEARREQRKNPHFDQASRDWRRQIPHADYTSASLKTSGLARWRYGSFEMRGRIDVRQGMWPAWWTLGDAGPWPECGEIDMMEYYQRTLLANAAWASTRSFDPTWDSVRTPLEKLGEKWGEQFHVWRMDWDEGRIALFVDGRLLNEIDLDKTFNEGADRKNPFRQPHYLLLSLAIGGDRGGDPSDTEFPGRFEVDWVRVYQK